MDVWADFSALPALAVNYNATNVPNFATPPPSLTSYNTINQGLVDSGWKDTVLVWPGERVTVAMKFAP